MPTGFLNLNANGWVQGANQALAASQKLAAQYRTLTISTIQYEQTLADLGKAQKALSSAGLTQEAAQMGTAINSMRASATALDANTTKVTVNTRILGAALKALPADVQTVQASLGKTFQLPSAQVAALLATLKTISTAFTSQKETLRANIVTALADSIEKSRVVISTDVEQITANLAKLRQVASLATNSSLNVSGPQLTKQAGVLPLYQVATPNAAAAGATGLAATVATARATDQLVAALGKVPGAASTAASSFSLMGNAAGPLNSIFTTLKVAASQLFGTLAAAAAVRTAVRNFADYDLTLHKIQAVIRDTIDPSEGLVNTMGRIEKSVQRVGLTTPYSIGQASSALLELVRAGNTANAAMKQLVPSLNLATSGDLDLATATDYVTTTLKQFHLPAEQASHVVDVLVETGNRSIGTIRDIAEGMKFAAPAALEMNQSLESVAAALAAMAQQNIKGTIAGTAYRGLLISLSIQNEELLKTLDQLKLKYSDIDPRVIGLTGSLQKLSAAGATQQQIFTIFNRRESSGGLALKQNLEFNNELIEALKNTKNAAQENADIINSSLQRSYQRLSATVNTLFTIIGREGLGRALTEGTDLLRNFLLAIAGFNDLTDKGATNARALAAAVKAVAIALTAATAASALNAGIGAISLGGIGTSSLASARAGVGALSFARMQAAIEASLIRMVTTTEAAFDAVVGSAIRAASAVSAVWSRNYYAVAASAQVAAASAVRSAAVMAAAIPIAAGRAVKAAGSALLTSSLPITPVTAFVAAVGAAWFANNKLLESIRLVGPAGVEMSDYLVAAFQTATDVIHQALPALGNYLDALGALPDGIKAAIQGYRTWLDMIVRIKEAGGNVDAGFFGNALIGFEARLKAIRDARVAAQKENEDAGVGVDTGYGTGTLVGPQVPEGIQAKIDAIVESMRKMRQEQSYIGKDPLTIELAQKQYDLQEQAIDAQIQGSDAARIARNEEREAIKATTSSYEELLEKQRQMIVHGQNLEKINEVSKDTADSIGSFFTNIITGAESASEAVRNLGKAFLDLLLQRLAIQPLVNALQTGISGGLAGFAASGMALSHSQVVPFGYGGVVSSPTLFNMSNGRTGLMGEKPGSDEGIFPLARTSKGELGVKAVGGGSPSSRPIQVNVTVVANDPSRFNAAKPQLYAAAYEAGARAARGGG